MTRMKTRMKTLEKGVSIIQVLALLLGSLPAVLAPTTAFATMTTENLIKENNWSTHHVYDDSDDTNDDDVWWGPYAGDATLPNYWYGGYPRRVPSDWDIFWNVAVTIRGSIIVRLLKPNLKWF